MRNMTMNAKFGSLASLVGTLVLGVAYVGATGVVSLVPTRTATAADEKEKAKNTVSKDLAKTLKAAQDAVQAKPPKYQDALAKLKDAEGESEEVAVRSARHQRAERVCLRAYQSAA